MANPVICIRDASIKNGQLMVADLFPNKSQASAVVEPAPQGPRYLRVVENEKPSVSNLVVTREVSGLTAYFLVTLDVDGGGVNPTVAQATAFADAVIAQMRDGAELSDLGGILGGVNNDNTGLEGEVGAGSSTATTANILAILGGAHFTVPAGTDVDNAYISVADQASLFDETVYAPIHDEDSSFHISLAEGFLSKAKSDRVDPRTNKTLDPLVVVYASNGALL